MARMYVASSSSSSTPLDVVKIPSSAEGGQIALMAFPGYNTRAMDISKFGLNDACEGDIRRAVRWGAFAVVSLVSTEELKLFRAPDLGARVKAAGMHWIHCPISDMRAPGKEFFEVWDSVWGNIYRKLRKGGKIVLHCAAGRGRTGTVAALILVSMGVNSKEAIRQVRTVRPGAIESKEQEQYVESLSM